MFFDDNVVNVEGARAFGIEAHVVRGLAETRARLVELDLLPSCTGRGCGTLAQHFSPSQPEIVRASSSSLPA